MFLDSPENDGYCCFSFDASQSCCGVVHSAIEIIEGVQVNLRQEVMQAI